MAHWRWALVCVRRTAPTRPDRTGEGGRLRAGSRAARTALALVALAALGGCGARTGIDVPDAHIDAARVHDAGPPPPPTLCTVVTPETPRATVDLEIPASLRVVDVMFLVDSTGSMQDEIDQVRLRLQTVVVPGVRSIIPDAAFGVALFGEFPVEPHADPGSGVEPYALRTPITTQAAVVEAALDRTPVWGNRDNAEAVIEGLYQVATGEGLSRWIDPGFGCAGGGVGGACFRSDAFRVVLVITDAPMHNGPGPAAPGPPDAFPYRFTPSPHSYRQAVEATRAADLFVIGLGADDAGRPSPAPHLQQLGRDTGSVDAAGQPLFFDIGGAGEAIGANVVDAVRRLAEDVPLDIDATVEDRRGDALDALDVVRGIVAARASPPDGVSGMEGSQFLGVRPGTLLGFDLEIDISGLRPSTARREYAARVVFRVSGRSRIETREVVIVVPGSDGRGCEG